MPIKDTLDKRIQAEQEELDLLDIEVGDTLLVAPSTTRYEVHGSVEVKKVEFLGWPAHVEVVGFERGTGEIEYPVVVGEESVSAHDGHFKVYPSNIIYKE